MAEIQAALSATIPGARLDVRQLETGPPVGIPVSIRVSGEDIPTLRRLADQVADIFRDDPHRDCASATTGDPRASPFASAPIPTRPTCPG